MTDLEISVSPSSQTENLPFIGEFTQLKLNVEAILFSCDKPIALDELRNLLGPQTSQVDLRLALKDLQGDYENRAFMLEEKDGKYQLRTRIEHKELLRKLYISKTRNLSKSALETLAIIAYQQPVTRAQINAIREVDCSAIISALREKDLIMVSGTRKVVGNPLEYSTTSKFLEVFGLSHLKDLPNLKSLQMTVDEQKQINEALTDLAKVGETDEALVEVVAENVAESFDLSVPDHESTASL